MLSFKLTSYLKFMKRLELILSNPLSLIAFVFAFGLLAHGYNNLPVPTKDVTVQYYFKGDPVASAVLSPSEILSQERGYLVLHLLYGWMMAAVAGSFFFTKRKVQREFWPGVLATLASLVMFFMVFMSITS